MIVVFIASHYQVFFSLFKAEITHWLGSFSRYVYVSEVLSRLLIGSLICKVWKSWWSFLNVDSLYRLRAARGSSRQTSIQAIVHLRSVWQKHHLRVRHLRGKAHWTLMFANVASLSLRRYLLRGLIFLITLSIIMMLVCSWGWAWLGYLISLELIFLVLFINIVRFVFSHSLRDRNHLLLLLRALRAIFTQNRTIGVLVDDLLRILTLGDWTFGYYASTIFISLRCCTNLGCTVLTSTCISLLHLAIVTSSHIRPYSDRFLILFLPVSGCLARKLLICLLLGLIISGSPSSIFGFSLIFNFWKHPTSIMCFPSHSFLFIHSLFLSRAFVTGLRQSVCEIE